MLKINRNKPIPGSLFYPSSGLHPELKNSWYLTVNERFPENHSLNDYTTNEMCYRVRARKIQNDYATPRSRLIAFDSDGEIIDPVNLTDGAMSRIDDSIRDGKYHGKLGKKDFRDMYYGGQRSDLFRSESRRPRVKFTGENGNIFNLMGIASRALKKDGQADKAEEMQNRIYSEAKDYDHAIRIIMEYVEVE